MGKAFIHFDKGYLLTAMHQKTFAFFSPLKEVLASWEQHELFERSCSFSFWSISVGLLSFWDVGSS